MDRLIGQSGMPARRSFEAGMVAIAPYLVTASPAMAQESSGHPGTFAYLIFFGVILALYFLPTIVAFQRGHPNRWIIGALNLALGATGIVWLGCLVWACGAVHKSTNQQGSDGGESGLNIFANDVKKVEVVRDDKLTPQEQIKQLERLERLLDTGVITNEQFEALKARVVASS